MNSPFISIILPAFNCEKTISDTLSSLQGQTYHDFELLIGLDGCTDGTASIIRQFQNDDKRIHIVTNPKNLGLGRTLNRLVSATSPQSKYIAMAEHDDWYIPERIESQVNFLEEHPECSLVSGIAEYISDGGRGALFPGILANGGSYPDSSPDMFKLNYREQIKVVNSCMMFRRNVHIDNGMYFSQRLPNVSIDWLYILRFSSEFKICGINQVLAKINRKPGNPSVTKNKSSQFLTARDLIKDIYREFRRSGIINKDDRNYALITQYILEARYYGGWSYLKYLSLIIFTDPIDRRWPELATLCFKKVLSKFFRH